MQMQLRFSVRAVPPGRERSAWRRRRRRGARVRWSLQKRQRTEANGRGVVAVGSAGGQVAAARRRRPL